MKMILFLSIGFCMPLISMEIRQEVGEEVRRVPSLKLLAFNVVKQNLNRLGWKTDRITNQMLDLIDSEMGNLPLFERARLIDIFKIQNQYDKIAQDVACYIDNHETSSQRKVALRELQTFSTEMQRKIAEFRKN